MHPSSETIVWLSTLFTQFCLRTLRSLQASVAAPEVKNGKFQFRGRLQSLPPIEE
jgi:hypothetical protein